MGWSCHHFVPVTWGFYSLIFPQWGTVDYGMILSPLCPGDMGLLLLDFPTVGYCGLWDDPVTTLSRWHGSSTPWFSHSGVLWTMGWSCHHFVPVTWVFYSLIFPQWGTVDYGMILSPLCPSDMGLLLLDFPTVGYCGLWDDPVTTLSRWHGASTPWFSHSGVLWTMGWSCHHFVPVTWVFCSLIFPQWGTVDYGMILSPLCPGDMGLLLLDFPTVGYCGLWDEPVTTLSQWHGSSIPWFSHSGVLWTMGWSCHHFVPVTWVFYSLIFPQWGTVDYGMSLSPLCPSDMGLLLLMFPQLGYCGLWDDPVTTLSRWHGSSTPYVPTIGVLWTMGWACHHFDPVTWVFYSLIFQQWDTVVTQKWRFPLLRTEI